MAQDGDTITYTYTGNKVTEDISSINTITIEYMYGAGGGDSGASAIPGNGGSIANAKVDVSSYDTLEIWVGGSGDPYETAGWGRANGLKGEYGYGAVGAGGGGSTELWTGGNSVFIAAADAGGGTGEVDGNYSAAGGGGARGGKGGGYYDKYAEGDGFGGRGGNAGANTSVQDAEDGGAERGIAFDGTTLKGGGNSGNGEIKLSFSKTKTASFYSNDWSSNSDWANTQSISNIDINSGALKLANPFPNRAMFQNPIYQYWAGVYNGSDGDSAFDYPEALTDSSASPVAGPIFRSDQSGFAAGEYDGSNDGHNALTANLPTGSVQVSFAALVYVPSAHTGRVFSYGDGGNGSSILLAVRNDNTVEATVLGGSYSFATGGTYPTGEWITIGASFDTDTADVVLNGSFVGTDGGSSYNINAQDAGFGYSGFENSFWFDGYIAEVIVSNAAEPEQAFSDYHTDRLG